MTCPQTPPFAPQRAELLGALIGLARATFGNEDLITPSTFAVVLEGLSAASSESTCSANQLSDLTHQVNEEKYKLVPSCFYCSSPCGRTSNYDLKELDAATENVRFLKLSVLAGLCDLAVGANSDADLPSDLESFVYRTLAGIGEDWSVDEISAVLAEIEKSVLANK